MLPSGIIVDEPKLEEDEEATRERSAPTRELLASYIYRVKIELSILDSLLTSLLEQYFRKKLSKIIKREDLSSLLLEML